MMRNLTKACLLFFVFCNWMPAIGQQKQIQYLSGTGSDHTVAWDFFCSGQKFRSRLVGNCRVLVLIIMGETIKLTEAIFGLRMNMAYISTALMYR